MAKRRTNTVSDAMLGDIHEVRRRVLSKGASNGAARPYDSRPELDPPRAWIKIIGEVPLTGTPLYRRKYVAHVLPFPFAHLLDPQPPNHAENVYAFNSLEVGNTDANCYGEGVDPASVVCGHLTTVHPIYTNFFNYSIRAERHWTWFESGDPKVGYFAWWFSLMPFLGASSGP